MTDLEFNEAMKDILGGDEHAFQQRLKSVDPTIIRGLYERSRELGKAHFLTADYLEAIEKYTGALCLAPSKADKASLFSNRAACYLKLDRIHDALNEARKAIATDQSFAKGWFRAGQALIALRKFEEAKIAFEKCASLADVDLNDRRNSATEVFKKWEEAGNLSFISKRSQRYAIDYSRFETMVKTLVQQETREQEDAADAHQLDIEFAEGTTPEQQAALRAQLTGEIDVDQLPKPHDGSGLNIAFDEASRTRECEKSKRDSLLLIFQTQYEARYVDRFFELLDSGFCSQFCTYLLLSLKSIPLDRSSLPVLFYGIGSLIGPLKAFQHLLSSRIDMPTIHVLSRGLSLVATETFFRVCEANKMDYRLHVQFHRDVDLFKPCESRISRVGIQENTQDNNGLSDDQEENLLNKGDCILTEATKKLIIPRSLSLLVIDLESVDGYLLGPRFMLLEKSCAQFGHTTLTFPAKIALLARLIRVPASVYVQHAAFRKIFRWSLQPIPVPQDIIKACGMSPALPVTSFPSPESSYNTTQVAHYDGAIDGDEGVNWTQECPLDGVLLYIQCVDFSGNIVFDGLTNDAGRSHLRPHILWLHRNMGEDSSDHFTQIQFPVKNSVILGAKVGAYDSSGSVAQGLGFKVHSTSFPDAVSMSCDRHAWPLWIVQPTESLKLFEKILTETTNFMRCAGTNQSRSRLSIVTTSSTQEISQLAPDINICCLDIGTVDYAVSVIRAALKRRLGLEVMFTHEREASLTLLETSQGSARLIRSLLRSCPGLLKSIQEHCWIRPPNNMQSGWQYPTSAEPIKPNSGQQFEADGVRSWLLDHETKNQQPRLVIKMGNIQLLRPIESTPSTELALCRLLGVPPGTPGLTSLAGCHSLPPLDILILGTPHTLPLDGVSSGLIRHAIYAKETLMKPLGQILPKGFTIYARLVLHKVEPNPSLNWDHVIALRCPVAADRVAESLYSTRSTIEFDKLVEKNLIQPISDPVAILTVDFNKSPDEIWVAFSHSRDIEIPSYKGGLTCNGIYLYTQYDDWPAPTQGLLQIHPPFQTPDILLISYTNISPNSFSLAPRVAGPDKPSAWSSPMASTLAMKSNELAMNLGQSLAASKNVVEQVAAACVSCGFLPCEDVMYDAHTVNTLFFAALS